MSGSNKILKRLSSATVMLLLLCWVSVASGKQTAWHSHNTNHYAIPAYVIKADSDLGEIFTDSLSMSVMQPSDEPAQYLSRKSNARKLAALLRLHMQTGSEQGRTLPKLPDAPLPLRAEIPYFEASRQYSDESVSLALLRTLQLPPHQNRLGGWKESNILYRGKLTYDQPDAKRTLVNFS
jgi:hypothetical protein